MFCSKCGNEVNDEAVVCPRCGCMIRRIEPMPQSATSAPTLESGETSGLATGALVCSFLIPIVGLILGIVGTVKYTTPSLKNRCITAIILSIVVWIVTIFLILLQ